MENADLPIRFPKVLDDFCDSRRLAAGDGQVLRRRRQAGGNGIVTGEQARPDLHKFRGEAEDWIVMVTDGVLCGREDLWVRDLMTGYQGESPSDLAQRILQASGELCQGEDDGTVLVLHLKARGEN